MRVAQYGATWPELRDRALRAERLGFAHLWVNDHLMTPGRLRATPAFDALSVLAALAPLTWRARLGTAVLSAAYRPPALAAKQAAVIDVISGGRLILGVGAGSDRAEHAAYGIPFGTRRERTAGLERLVATVRALGEHPRGATVPGLLEHAPSMPPPPQRPHPPLWVAAHGPRLLDLAGREADG
ncbi:MAG: LLM class flavin-dependent oxidoreductase, partial [Thermoleophilia bacterium]|nr:LLM class flavin-dependent oxidoreductase [Thermoleophilia bacterium]